MKAWAFAISSQRLRYKKDTNVGEGLAQMADIVDLEAFVLLELVLVLLKQIIHLHLYGLVLFLYLVDADVVLFAVVNSFEDLRNRLQ